jgi:hypothetical protein
MWSFVLFVLTPADGLCCLVRISSPVLPQMRQQNKAVSSAGLRPKSDCTGKAQAKLYGISVETAK